MGWFSDIGEGMGKSFSTLPKWFRSFALILFWLSVGAFAVVTIGEMTYSTIARMLPVTAEDIRAAERKVEFEKRAAEVSQTQMLVFDRTKAQREMEEANVEAHRMSLGLPVKRDTTGVGGLAALGEVVTTNLSTIVALMFLVYLLPTFATTGDPWRLSLNISAIVILAGLFAIMKEVASESKIQVELPKIFMTFSSASVGLFLMLFGTVLAGFSLYMLRKHEREVRSEGCSSDT